MSDTPLTQSLYDEHRYFANEEEATEAILGFRDLCQQLERENAKLRETLKKVFAHLGNEIKRMSLNESAATGTQKLSAEVAAVLDGK